MFVLLAVNFGCRLFIEFSFRTNKCKWSFERINNEH